MPYSNIFYDSSVRYSYFVLSKNASNIIKLTTFDGGRVRPAFDGATWASGRKRVWESGGEEPFQQSHEVTEASQRGLLVQLPCKGSRAHCAPSLPI